MPYEGLDHALRYFKIQVIDSVPFAKRVCPRFDTPEQLFYWLKKRLVYKNDPIGVELFQTMQRLMTTNNYHGITGAGDCDCFTITSLACCIAQDWQDLGIKLCGRQPGKAVHIYQYIDFDGQRDYLDLTNNTYDYQRYYPLYQELKFRY